MTAGVRAVLQYDILVENERYFYQKENKSECENEMDSDKSVYESCEYKLDEKKESVLDEDSNDNEDSDDNESDGDDKPTSFFSETTRK